MENNVSVPKVSVVMSTYNRQELLNKCLEHIHKQTFKDWSLLVINDCSSDDTSNILDWWSREDARIGILTNKENIGPICKSHYLLEANTKYVAMVDDDDFWEPTYLEEQVKGLEKNSSKIMGLTDCWYLKNNRKKYGNSGRERPYLQLAPSCAVFLTKAYQQAGGFDPLLKEYHAELDLYLRLGGLKNFVYIKKPLVTINRGKETMSSNKKISAENLLLVIHKNWSIFGKNKSLLSGYYKIVGLNYIEAHCLFLGKLYLQKSLKVKVNIEALGALVLTSISRKLFLIMYNLYRRLLGYV